MPRWMPWVVLGLTTGLVASAGCEFTNTTPGTGGSGGAAGCPYAPEALFTVHVTAADGAMPPDTVLRVRSSAGEEPAYDLADPESWTSADDGFVVECNVDRDATPPLELDELVCELWTSGVTELELAADGYVTLEETLSPAEREGCEGFVPSEAELELLRDVDAGR